MSLLATLQTTLQTMLGETDPVTSLVAFRRLVPGRLVFTTSFGLEDQVITHLIATAGLSIDIVTLDTGRLFPETHAVWAETEARYSLRILAYVPAAGELERLIGTQGIDGFRDSVAARKACCHVRKVAPLARVLEGAQGWITGLRADQSAARAGADLVAFDETFGLFKLNPLIGWSRDQASAFAERHAVPVNALHGRGFPSIGCAPCTRAIAPGEPERAGRWWWENEDRKECGLHVTPDGRLLRVGTEGRA